MISPTVRRIGAYLAIAVSLGQIVVGSFGIAEIGLLERPGAALLPAWVYALQMLVFASASGFLITRDGVDDRAGALAAIFALIAAAFARRPIEHFATQASVGYGLALVQGLRVDAFLPWFVWLFFGDFPRSIRSRRIAWIASLGSVVAFMVGAMLVLANVWIALRPETARIFAKLGAADPRSAYWLLVYGLVAAAIPFAVWKSRHAPVDERRRASLFTIGIAFSTLPVCAFVVADIASPRFAHWLEGGGDAFLLPIIESFILMVPVTTTYAVVVGHVIPIGIFVRQRVAYGFARFLMGAGSIAPLLWIAWAGLQLRGETLQEIFSGRRLALSGMAILVAMIAFRLRGPARDAIDRAFFRDAFDSRRLLISLARKGQENAGTREWARGFAKEIDGALHIDSIAILVLDPLSSTLTPQAGFCRALKSSSGVAEILRGSAMPMRVDLDQPKSIWRTLPETERHWLADGAFEFLVPLVGAGGNLLAVFALGRKRSELPFSAEDRELLAAVAASASPPLESELARRAAPKDGTPIVEEAAARECRQCGGVFESGDQCPDCDADLDTSALPYTPLERFRLERRMGAGSMGVVYRANDLTLDRTVAIKTLPARSPEDAVALRKEARAMAAVESPHLARIYSAETWMGSPFIITEFMFGGMLDERLGSPMAAAELAPLGMRLAHALRDLHGAGLLHRDIKPSNIGYGADGTARLIDFGLAHFFEDRAEKGSGQSEEWAVGDSQRATRRTGGLFGTPLYLSPETLRGEPADVTADLWALALVLCELCHGTHPFERRTWRETQRGIEHGWSDRLTLQRREEASDFDAFFAEALAPTIGERPANADEFLERWQDAASTSL